MSEKTNHDEAHMTTPELIKAHGYISEIHHVWTEDGYCLELHRILSAKNDNSTSVINSESQEFVKSSVSKHPVLVVHGLLSSSADWIILGPEKALAYALCDNGFDVWLGNARGNTYSQKHKTYTIKDRQFWDFSWHEIGYYDVPMMVNYVLEKTGYSDIYYVGHSQGTTAFYIMCSERPEFNAKIRGMISLAPIAFLWNQRSPLLKCVVHFYNVMEWGSVYCNIHRWFPRSKLQARALGTFFRNAPHALSKGFCHCWFSLIAGFGSVQLDKAILPLIFGHFPAGASAKQIIHYGQSILSGSFCKFDYGAKENLKLYGSTQPPKYNLQKVKAPVLLVYSEQDFLTHPLDVQRLADKLPNVIEVKKIENIKFNHVDFLWGRDVRTILYNSLIATLKRL